MKHIFKMAAIAALALTFFSGCSYPDDKNDEDNNSTSDSGGGDGNNNQNNNSGGGGNSKIPARVTAVGSSSKSITISWTAVPDAGYYKVYRNDEESGPYTLANSWASGTSWEDRGLAGHTTYYYKVAAYGNGGEGELSAVVSATTSN